MDSRPKWGTDRQLLLVALALTLGFVVYEYVTLRTYRKPDSAWIQGEWKYDFLETIKMKYGGALPDETVLKRLRQISQDHRDDRLIISKDTRRFHYLQFEIDLAEYGFIQENQVTYRGKGDNKKGFLTAKKLDENHIEVFLAVDGLDFEDDNSMGIYERVR